MESYTNVSYASSEQHVDASVTRISRDVSDLSKLVQFFENHNPFPVTPNIMSIGTGIIGDNDKINCYKAREIGNLALRKIINDTFGTVKKGRKNKVLSLKSATSSVKIDEEIVSIDPTLIFQRASLSIQTKGEMELFLEHELATYPLTLFDASGMRKNNKAKFYINFDMVKDISVQADDYFVIDGGFLLHKMVWKEKTPVKDIIDLYINYITSHYSFNCCIVFDGYPEQVGDCHTKSAERMRRQNKNLGHRAEFDENGIIFEDPDKFLSIDSNKVRLIQLLCKELSNRNFSTNIAEEDADVMIIETAMQQINEKKKHL
ncbi:hypothetical protein TKK_0011685 [Trichogramma kaykai]